MAKAKEAVAAVAASGNEVAAGGSAAAEALQEPNTDAATGSVAVTTAPSSQDRESNGKHGSDSRSGVTEDVKETASGAAADTAAGKDAADTVRDDGQENQSHGKGMQKSASSTELNALSALMGLAGTAEGGASTSTPNSGSSTPAVKPEPSGETA